MAWQRSIAQWKQSELPTSNWRFENPSSRDQATVRWAIINPPDAGHNTPKLTKVNPSAATQKCQCNWPTTKQTKVGTKT